MQINTSMRKTDSQNELFGDTPEMQKETLMESHNINQPILEF